MKPRCVTICATILSREDTKTAKNTKPILYKKVFVCLRVFEKSRWDTALLSPDGLQREVFVFERDVVFELVEGQLRAAAAAEVGHLELARGPDALNVPDVGVVQAPHRLILDVVLETRERVVVLAHPHDGSRVLRRFRLARRRLDLPARRAVHGVVAHERVVELIDVALLEVLEAEVGAEETRRSILQGDAPVALDRRRPHPLVRRAI